MRQRKIYSSLSVGATRKARIRSLYLFAVIALFGPALAHADQSRLVVADANQLESGGYMWDSSLAPDGSMSMVIDLTTQRAFVYRGGTLIGISMIASGKPGYETPRGIFTVLEKQRHHNSNKYDNAPMPYMQRLSWSGLALHGGHPHGHPASHGCIRLPMGFAAALFAEDTRGMPVEITGYWSRKPETVTASRAYAPPSAPPDEQTTKTLNEQSYANAPAPTVTDEAGDQTTNRTTYNDINPNPDQVPNEQPGPDQNEENNYRSEPPPPPDFPPPPG